MPLYFIVGGGSTKIGTARDPARRLQQIQSGNPSLLRVTYQCDGGHDLERKVWTLLRPRLIRGEWFTGEIGSVEAERIVKQAHEAPAALSSKEARAQMATPRCDCHRLPMYWARAEYRRGGGYWRCSIGGDT